MTALPTNISYGKVRGRFGSPILSAGDADGIPDFQPLSGLEVIFTPKPDVILNLGASPVPVTFLTEKIVCTLDDDGYLVGPDGREGVNLIATDDADLAPTGWTYNVSFGGNLATYKRLATFDISVPADSSRWLTAIAPIPSASGTSTLDAAQAAIIQAGVAVGQAQTAASSASAAAAVAVAATATKVDKGALVISVKEHGAVGNGTNDDTTAIQSAINACESTGSDLLFPAGRYKVTAPLLLPVAITIRGVSNASGGVFSSSPVVHNCVVETYTGTVFAPKGTAPQVTRLAIQDLEFTNKQSPIATYGPPSVLFSSGITLSGSKIERITAFGYGTIFAGPITIVSVVSKCFFIQVWTVFNASSITDSQIKDNYISGTPSANATGLKFDGATAMCVVSGNFIEFLKYGIQWTSGAAASNVVTHNRFDYCYRAIGSTAGALSGVVISNNTFHMSKQTNGLVYLTAPDAAMSTNPWVAIDAPAGITYTSIVGNFFDTGDTAISVRGYPVRDFTTSGNGYRNVTTKVDYLAQLSGNPGDQTGIHITELDRQKVTTLPSPSITSSTIVSFDRQQLYVNGKLVFNNAGTWVDAIGASSSTYSIGTAPQVDVFTAGSIWTKPAWASTISGVVIAGGGGSGSGRRGAAGTIRGGGGGGGGAGVTTFTMAASALTSTVAVTVGAGGTAGAAVTADSTSGNAGGAGAASTFGAYARATGGTGGGGGTVGSGSAGTGGLGTLSGGPGVASSSSGGVGNPANGVTASTVGGASGGGITVADVPGAGGTGVAAPSVKNSFRSGGLVDGTAPNGADAGYPNTATFGGSGGGGAASITTTAQNGTPGGIYGGGASGGGASLNGNNSGAGQVGGDGIVVIVST